MPNSISLEVPLKVEEIPDVTGVQLPLGLLISNKSKSTLYERVPYGTSDGSGLPLVV